MTLPLLFLIAVIVFGLYQTVRVNRLKNENAKIKKQLQKPAEIIRQEEDALIEKVKKLIDIPAERPTIATVADKTKLKNQAFFQKAENGDKLLLFVKARKVILYRESKNRIVDVGVLNVNQNTTPSTSGQEGQATEEEEGPTAPKPTPTEKPQNNE